MPPKYERSYIEAKLGTEIRYANSRPNNLGKDELINAIEKLPAIKSDLDKFYNSQEHRDIHLREMYHKLVNAVVINTDCEEIDDIGMENVIDRVLKGEDPSKAFDAEVAGYQKRVPEEDRFRKDPEATYFNKMNVPKDLDILDMVNTQLEFIRNPKNGKGNFNISTIIGNYHVLEQANAQRSWFSKAWSAIKGFFGSPTEDKMLAEMKEAIITESGLNRDLMEKAFTVPSEDHVARVVNVAQIRRAEELEKQEQAREQMDISNGEIDDDYDFEDEYENDSPDLSNQKSKDGEELEV